MMEQSVEETRDSMCGCEVKKCVAPVARLEFRQAISRMLAAESEEGYVHRSHEASFQ